MHNARMMYRRGFDNVHLLRGTVNEFYQNFPELVVGEKLPKLESIESSNWMTDRGEEGTRNQHETRVEN